MNFDFDLPHIEDTLTESPLTESDETLSEYSDFEITFVHIEDPPKVEVKREHIIEAVNKAELDSLLVSLDSEGDTAVFFHITENTSTAYTGSYADGVQTIVDVLLCEDWFALQVDTDSVPESVSQFLTEMTVIPDGKAKEGELYTQTYGKNQLKYRIQDLKESEDGLFYDSVESKTS